MPSGPGWLGGLLPRRQLSEPAVEAWLREAFAAERLGVTLLPAALLLGVVGSLTSCCTLPVLGAVAGYAGSLDERTGRRQLYVVAAGFLLGTVLALAALGAVTSLLGQVAAASLGRYWRFAAGLALVAFGLVALRLLDPRLPGFARAPLEPGRGAAGAIVYGLTVGGASTACTLGCNPLLAMALGATAAQGAPVLGALVLATFALGFGLPLAAALLGLGWGLGRLRLGAQRLAPYLNTAAGALLVALGFYLLATV